MELKLSQMNGVEPLVEQKEDGTIGKALYQLTFSVVVTKQETAELMSLSDSHEYTVDFKESEKNK